MITGIPQSGAFKWTYRAYVTLFFIYLALPLTTVCVFAFNDSVFPSLPWEGFTWAWFFGDNAPYIGVFHERAILRSIVTSGVVAFWVSLLAVAVGTTNAFLFVRHDFRGKGVLYILMLLPLIIPGIILGISILVFTSSVANYLEDATGMWFDHLCNSGDFGAPAKVRPQPRRGRVEPRRDQMGCGARDNLAVPVPCHGGGCGGVGVDEL